MTAEGHKVVSPTGGYEGAQRDVPRANKLLRFGTFITEVSQAWLLAVLPVLSAFPISPAKV